jgi:YD repeat-containing protein
LASLGFSNGQFGNPTGMSDSLGGSMGYTYNGENQMTGESLALNGTTAATLSMSYDGLARLSGTTMTSPSGATIASSDTYDNASRLTNISYKDGDTTLASYTYGYNAASQIPFGNRQHTKE